MNLTHALAVETAINNFLNIAGDPGVLFASVGAVQEDGNVDPFGVYWLPYELQSDGINFVDAAAAPVNGPIWRHLSIEAGGFDFPDLIFAPWARATLVGTIPLPAALPLFGTSLGILGFLGWRRRKAQAA